MSAGVITKLIKASHQGPDEAAEGYGIIRDAAGSESYFTHLDLLEGRFAELKVGQRVQFTRNLPPLDRAASVVVCQRDTERQGHNQSELRSATNFAAPAKPSKPKREGAENELS